MPLNDDLQSLSDAELAQACIDAVVAFDATEHVGKANRLADHRSKIVNELKAREEGRSVLQRLADHSNAQVRAWAKSDLDRLDKPAPAPEPAPKHRLRSEILWQCDNPPPVALTRNEIAERLRQSVPESCSRLMNLALPAI